MKKIFLILLALGLFACKQTTPITEQPISPEIEAKLYELLKRVPYVTNSEPQYNYFYASEIMTPESMDNAFGEVEVSLLPKTVEFNPYILDYFGSSFVLESDKFTETIHNLSPEEISRYFDVLIFVIDSKYLEKSKEEQSYHMYPYKIVSYLLKDGQWCKGAIFTVENEEENLRVGDEQRDYWRSIVTPYQKKCQVKAPNDLSERVVRIGKYDLEKLHSCDLNEDGKVDHLFSFAEQQGGPNASRKVVLLLSQEGEYKYKLLIAPHFCYMDWPLHQIVCKGEYFTLEFKGDNFLAEAYITFKYNKYANDFLLHRYGYIDLSGGEQGAKKEVQLTTKDFGEVYFQDFYIEEFDHMIDGEFSGEEE